MKKWLVVVLILAFWLVAGLAIWKLKKPAAVVLPAATPAASGSEPASLQGEPSSAAPGPWQGTGSESGVIDEGEEVVK